MDGFVTPRWAGSLQRFLVWCQWDLSSKNTLPGCDHSDQTSVLLERSLFTAPDRVPRWIEDEKKGLYVVLLLTLALWEPHNINYHDKHQGPDNKIDRCHWPVNEWWSAERYYAVKVGKRGPPLKDIDRHFRQEGSEETWQPGKNRPSGESNNYGNCFHFETDFSHMFNVRQIFYLAIFPIFKFWNEANIFMNGYQNCRHGKACQKSPGTVQFILFLKQG